MRRIELDSQLESPTPNSYARVREIVNVLFDTFYPYFNELHILYTLNRIYILCVKRRYWVIAEYWSFVTSAAYRRIQRSQKLIRAKSQLLESIVAVQHIYKLWRHSEPDIKRTKEE